MATYLVTGGCGFIGSSLTACLIMQGHHVVVLDDLSNGQNIHPQATFVQEDVREYTALPALFSDIDGCFHLAAIPTVNISLEQWFAYHAINLTGGLNIFKAAIKAGNIPVVYASSCSVYGKTQQLPLTEHAFIQPICAYACDKLALELNAHFLAEASQLPSMGLRFFNVYGPNQPISSPYSGVITRFISNILEDKPLTIYGDGHQTRDFVFVEDVVDNLIHAMRILQQGAHIVNICTGRQISIHYLLGLLEQYFQRHCTREYQPARVFEAQYSYGDCQKMQSYGFKTAHSFAEGLQKTLDHRVRIRP